LFLELKTLLGVEIKQPHADDAGLVLTDQYQTDKDNIPIIIRQKCALIKFIQVPGYLFN